MFGQKLKELRKQNFLTQADLGKKIGVSPSAIGMYEQGHREPDQHTLLKICDIFDVPTDYLINPKRKCSIFFNQYCEHELDDVVNNFNKALLQQKNIQHNGSLLDQEDLKKITDAIKMAISYSLTQNKK
jgi:transcriptional regulator with XRE-family HTH domain